MKLRQERRDFEERVNFFGKNDIRIALVSGLLTSKQVAEMLNIRRTSSLYRSFIKELNITLPKTSLESRRMKVLFKDNYWDNKELVEILVKRLQNPTINSNSRYVITFPQHPRASKVGQIKAHIVSWEIHNKQYLPNDYGIYFKDRSSFNISPNNLEAKPLSEIKSLSSRLEKNFFWTGGKSKHINYFGGWKRISKSKIANNNCKICNSNESLIVHHMIPYSTFTSYDLANSDENLIVVCRHCHGKIHYNKINPWRHIDEIQYEKLLKLLEHLKSQSSDKELETIHLIEQQIEQTDNQQPSSLPDLSDGEGSETISKESRVEVDSKKEGSL